MGKSSQKAKVTIGNNQSLGKKIYTFYIYNIDVNLI